MEQNKTGKYFKYAIGEIVLVVIGILIALSINNWNEHRKNQILVNNYKISLIKDLVKDTIAINIAIKMIKEDSTALNAYEKRIAKPTATLDTLLKIARYEYDFYISILVDLNNDTFKVLSSTGNIALFSDDLISELNTINNLQEEVKSTTEKTFNNYGDALTNYSLKHPIPFQSNLIKSNTKIADTIWNNVSLINHATEFNALILRKGDSYRLALWQLPKLLKETNALLQKLHKS